MDPSTIGQIFVVIFMFALSAAAIKIAIDSDKKQRTIYDKHAHSKPRDGDNT